MIQEIWGPACAGSILQMAKVLHKNGTWSQIPENRLYTDIPLVCETHQW